MMAGGGTGNMAALMRVLTPEQRESLMDANRSNQAQTQDLEERIRTARKAILEASLAPKFDEANLRAKLEAAAKLEADLTVLRAKTLAKMEPPLSEEQIKQITAGPIGGNMPQRFQGQFPGAGPDGARRERLPFGNQPLPPPEDGPRNGPPPGQ
jgi:Spy/CpxP family protein refolding chaperone